MITEHIKHCILKYKHTGEKCNIFLDLDNTLISSIKYNTLNDTYRNLKCKSHIFNFEYIIYERPYVQKLLTFLFKYFNVHVWSAASKDYVLFIVDKVILENYPNRKINLVLYSDHCKISMITFNNKTPKDLRLLWDKINNKVFNKNNTFIIDDLKDVNDAQPNNCINVRAFDLEKYPAHDNDIVLQTLVSDFQKLFL